MKAHLLLWLATAGIALALSAFVPRVESRARTSPADACRHAPVAHAFAWASGGHLICMAPAKAAS